MKQRRNIKNINLIGGGNHSKYTYGKIIVRYTPNERLTIDTTGTASNKHVGMRNGVPPACSATSRQAFLYSGPPYKMERRFPTASVSIRTTRRE